MLATTRFIALALTCYALGAIAPQAVSHQPDSKNMQARTVDRRVHLNPPGANDSRYALYSLRRAATRRSDQH